MSNLNQNDEIHTMENNNRIMSVVYIFALFYKAGFSTRRPPVSYRIHFKSEWSHFQAAKPPVVVFRGFIHLLFMRHVLRSGSLDESDSKYDVARDHRVTDGAR